MHSHASSRRAAAADELRHTDGQGRTARDLRELTGCTWKRGAVRGDTQREEGKASETQRRANDNGMRI